MKRKTRVDAVSARQRPAAVAGGAGWGFEGAAGELGTVHGTRLATEPSSPCGGAAGKS